MAGEHDGHRERLRKQFLNDGFSENTPPHKLLEMLLFYSIPRKDTNVLAHNLIEKFGSFSGVLDAPVGELIKVKGVSENTAALLKLIMPIARLYYEDKNKDIKIVKNVSQAGDYLASKYIGKSLETVFLLCLDNAGRILKCSKLSEGDDISVAVSARTVVSEALSTGATAVMLSHNHPKGFAFPSNADIETTKKTAIALAHVGITLLDHIIVADGDYISMRQSKEYKNIFYIDK